MAGIASLEIGKRALQAQKIGLDVTSNNIANVNTPGYSRRNAVLTESDPLNSNGNYFGTGVIVDKLQSFREEYYDKEIRNSNSRYNSYSTDSQYFQKIETVLNEPSDQGVGEMINDFFKNFDTLSLNPENFASRQSVISSAQTLTERINQTSIDLSDLRNESKKNAEQSITKINSLLQDIASLNTSIVQSKASVSGEFQTYIDNRANKLEELSQYFDITIGNNEDGSANIFVNGTNLLTSNIYSEVKLNESVNQVSGERNLTLVKYDNENKSSLDLQVQSGKIASDLKIFNVYLDNLESSSGYSIAKSFNKFVTTFASEVNQLTQKGFGLNDKGTSAPGRNLFEPTDGSLSAFNIKVPDSLINIPSDLPVSDVVNEPGNSNIARSIARLAQNTGFLDNQTPSDYYSNFLGKIGSLSQDAANGSQTTKLISDQLNSHRESIMGVNLDEEAVNLIKYQKAFEASSKIVTMTNEIMTTIINLGK
jgi:flagellar hook-associated protein 1 FlgK